MQLPVVRVAHGVLAIKRLFQEEAFPEKTQVPHYVEEDDGGESHDEAHDGGANEELLQRPLLRERGARHCIPRDGHHRAVVQQGHQQDHKGWHVKLVGPDEHGEGDDDADYARTGDKKKIGGRGGDHLRD